MKFKLHNTVSILNMFPPQDRAPEILGRDGLGPKNTGPNVPRKAGPGFDIESVHAY